jgi:ATP phosphoribosyltransferase
MSGPLVLALPSKGRLMEQCAEVLARAGLVVSKTGAARGYKGEIAGLPGVEVNFVSSSEIAQHLKSGKAHLGIFADVVVAVPAAWIDVRRMADLEEMAQGFRRMHGRRVRVATKYMNLTRRFFAQKGVTGYRIVESLGATEGAPAALLAELIVDITTTGATLRANGLKVLDDGVVLKSQANLVSSNAAAWSPELRRLEREVSARLSA